MSAVQEWFASINGENHGPMSLHDVVNAVQTGRFSLQTLVWKSGMEGWVALEQVQELLAHLPAPQPTKAAPAPSTALATASTANALAHLDGEALDKIFGQIVKDSWRYYASLEGATKIDDVFVGALITSSLDNGYSLIDLNSDGQYHYLRFENLQDKTRIFFRATHLTPSLLQAQVSGHMAALIVGYGEKTSDFGRLWEMIKAEYKSGYIHNPEPGTITFDADVNSGYIYAQIDLFWRISTYITDRFDVDAPAMARDIGAILAGLKKYLRGRAGR